MNIPFAARTGLEIEFKIRVSPRGLPNVFEGALSDGGTTEVGMQNDSGCVDDGSQRVAERASEFISDGRFYAGQCESESSRIKMPGGNRSADIAEHDAACVSDGGLAVMRHELADSWPT